MPDTPPLTDRQEVLAYAAAHVIKVAAAFATARFYAPALFTWAYRAAGPMGVAVASLAQGVAWAAVGLALFLALRPSIGMTPEIVRRAGGTTTAGFELGAYAGAQAIGIVLGYLAFSTLMPVLYPMAGIGGMGAALVISLAVGAVIAALEFLLFVWLRRRLA